MVRGRVRVRVWVRVRFRVRVRARARIRVSVRIRMRVTLTLTLTRRRYTLHWRRRSLGVAAHTGRARWPQAAWQKVRYSAWMTRYRGDIGEI